MVDKLKIIEIDIEKITEYENNAKLHPDYHIQRIAKSIEQFGFNDPIAIDENNVIIEGHGRYQAAKLLKFKKVPVIKLAHLNEAEKKAYIIAHNKLTMDTGFDEEILQKEISAIINSKDLDLENFECLGIDVSFIQKCEKNIDLSEFMDSTQERKTDQQNNRPKVIMVCPKCGHEWEK